MDLFTLDSFAALSYPSPAEFRDTDSPWRFAQSRRAEQLLRTRDHQNREWLCQASEFALDTGDYRQAIAFARRAVALSTDVDPVNARASLVECMAHLERSEGPLALTTARDLEARAAGSPDPAVLALCDFALALSLWGSDANPGPGMGGPEAEEPRWLAFERLAVRLIDLGEINSAIRSLLQSARIQLVNGKFFSGLDVIQAAWRLSEGHGVWSSAGRLIFLYSSTAADQGYRRGVEDAIRRAIEWCDYLGDAFGRIEARAALGRLLAYEMPPDDPTLLDGPDQHLRRAAEEAEALGVTGLAAHVDSVRYWLFKKAGKDLRRSDLSGSEPEPAGERERLADQRKAEAVRITAAIQLNTASRLYDGVQDSQDAFFVFDTLRDREGRCRDFNGVYVNATASRIYEQGGRQVYLFSEAQLLPPLRALGDAIVRAVEDRASYEDVYEVEESRYLQRRVVPSGEGAVISIRDVTAEKRIEAALREAAESAERSERAKTAFLASMSHEIRTPLNGVLGLARMLSETGLSETQKSYVDDIVLSGDLLLELIGGVLDLSKIESHEMALASAPVALPDLVGAIAKLFRGQAQEKSTKVTFHIDPSVPKTVLGDAVRLRQILANLVGNAVKFTREGKVEIRVTMEGGLVVFEVRDTGIGIPEDRLESIFARFEQASDPGFGGTGLGLTITKAFVELMGGEIGVTSVAGQGSSFKVRLPLPEAQSPVPAPQSSAPLRFDGCRVLLVDDNRVNVLVSTHSLRKFGCEVIHAEDGVKALERLASERFDLVFMDVRMPVMNGLEATAEIRRREGEGPRTPIIALTANALLQEQQECFQAGMDDFATKPITSDSIQEVLVKWLAP